MSENMNGKIKRWTIERNEGIGGFAYLENANRKDEKLYKMSANDLGVTISIVDYTDRSDAEDETTVIDEYFISNGNEKICTHRRETFKPDWKITWYSREYKGGKDKTEAFDNDYSVLVKDAEAFNEMEKFSETILEGFKTERVEKAEEGGKYMEKNIKKIDKDISEYESRITKVKEVQKTIQKAVSKADIRLVPRGCENGCEINMFFGGLERGFEYEKAAAIELVGSTNIAADRKYRELPAMPRYWKHIFVDFKKYNGKECKDKDSVPDVDEAAKILKGIKKVKRYNPKNDMRGEEIIDIQDVVHKCYTPNMFVYHSEDKIHLKMGKKPAMTTPETADKELEDELDYIVC